MHLLTQAAISTQNGAKALQYSEKCHSEHNSMSSSEQKYSVLKILKSVLTNMMLCVLLKMVTCYFMSLTLQLRTTEGPGIVWILGFEKLW